MDYSHSRKAGNQGDVWKHAVVTAVAEAIEVGEEVLYVEPHSGVPVHPLVAGGEWLQGAGRLPELQQGLRIRRRARTLDSPQPLPLELGLCREPAGRQSTDRERGARRHLG